MPLAYTYTTAPTWRYWVFLGGDTDVATEADDGAKARFGQDHDPATRRHRLGRSLQAGVLVMVALGRDPLSPDGQPQQRRCPSMPGHQAQHQRRLAIVVEVGPVHCHQAIRSGADLPRNPTCEAIPDIDALVAQQPVHLLAWSQGRAHGPPFVGNGARHGRGRRLVPGNRRTVRATAIFADQHHAIRQGRGAAQRRWCAPLLDAAVVRSRGAALRQLAQPSGKVVKLRPSSHGGRLVPRAGLDWHEAATLRGQGKAPSPQSISPAGSEAGSPE